MSREIPLDLIYRLRNSKIALCDEAATWIQRHALAARRGAPSGPAAPPVNLSTGVPTCPMCGTEWAPSLSPAPTQRVSDERLAIACSMTTEPISAPLGYDLALDLRDARRELAAVRAQLEAARERIEEVRHTGGSYPAQIFRACSDGHISAGKAAEAVRNYLNGGAGDPFSDGEGRPSIWERAESAEQQLATLREVLKSVEWKACPDTRQTGACPSCGSSMRRGGPDPGFYHHDDCKLAAALRGEATT